MATAGSLAAACAANMQTIPIDKLLMEHGIRHAMNKPLSRRRRTPNEKVGQHLDSKMPLSSPEKRSRITTADNGETCERVRVTVRVRPPTLLEEQRDEDGAPFIFLDSEKNTVILRRKGSFVDFTEFQFDDVLPSAAQQVDVYNCAARHVVLDVLQGYNGTIMAYGQTGAGKTYTLSDKLCIGGTTVEGIIPRSAAEIFAAAEQDNTHDYHVSMSYTQIYMEQIQDLLRPDSSNMQIREGESGVYLSGVEEVQVNSADDVMKLLLLGDQNRVFSFTKLVRNLCGKNAHSSRSHAIVILTVEKKATCSSPDNQPLGMKNRLRCTAGLLESERVLVGKLFLVDLAGSERLKKSGSEGLRASEAMSVNLSLTCLGKCISARADQNSTHVPFRDSKLTRLLQESLGGNTKTSLIINIAPCNDFLQETLSSLLFGSRAMKVATRAIINVEEEFRVLTKNLQETLDMQDERLQSLEASVTSKEEQLLQALKSLEERTRQVDMLKEEQSLFNEKFMEQLRVKDERWRNRLEVVRNAAAESNKKRIHHLQIELEKMKAMEAIERGGKLQVLSNGLAKDFAARIIQRSYRQRYLTMLQKEKKNLELVTSFQLMANSATKVITAMKGIDEYFTKSFNILKKTNGYSNLNEKLE